MKKITSHIDWFILIPVVGLLLFSTVFVYSASAPYSAEEFSSIDKLFWKQTISVIISLFVLIFVSKIDYHIYEKIGKPIIFISVILLILVLIFGGKVNEPDAIIETTKAIDGDNIAEGVKKMKIKRWLNIGPISIQPVEFVKFAIVIYFAALLVKKQNVIKTFEYGFLPFIVWIVIVCVFVALQPNFSNMFLIFLIGMIMLFVGNANLLHLMAVGLAGIVSAGIFAVSADYRLARLLSYFGIGEAAPNVAGYQLNQALIALGNGGLYGLGAGQSKQSYGFLPESYGDFIFSVIGEEYGFIGLLIIFIAFGIIFYRGMRIAKNAPDLFGYFLSIGIIIVIALYLFTHTAVNIGLFPTTGVPLPFISYGGTAVIVYSAAIGILLNISSQTNIFSINPKNKNKGEQNNER